MNILLALDWHDKAIFDAWIRINVVSELVGVIWD